MGGGLIIGYKTALYGTSYKLAQPISLVQMITLHTLTTTTLQASYWLTCLEEANSLTLVSNTYYLHVAQQEPPPLTKGLGIHSIPLPSTLCQPNHHEVLKVAAPQQVGRCKARPVVTEVQGLKFQRVVVGIITRASLGGIILGEGPTS